MNDEKETEKPMSEQELVYNIQVLREQAKVLASNIDMLTMYLQELVTAKATLEGVHVLKKGDEILVPIGGAAFIRARIDDTEAVIAGIGANVSADKSMDQAVAHLGKKIEMTQSTIKENQERYMKVAAALDELNSRAQSLLQEKGENV